MHRIRTVVAVSVTAMVLGAVPVSGIAAATGSGDPSGSVSQTAADGAPICTEPQPLVDTTSAVSSPPPVASDPLGADPGEGSTATEFLKILGEGGIHFGEDEGLGWLLSVMTHEQGDGSSAQIEKTLTQVQSQLNALQNQIYQMCNAVTEKLNELENAIHRSDYDTQAVVMGTYISDVDSFEKHFSDIVNYLDQNPGTTADQLSIEDRTYLANMRLQLPDIIDHINGVMTANDQPGANGMIALYSEMLVDKLGYNPSGGKSATHVFPAEYVDAGYDQQDYYSGVLAEAVNLYFEAGHLDFTYQGEHYQPINTTLDRTVQRAQGYLQTWSDKFSMGEDGWVTHGIGPIPADTVLDYRNPAAPLLWTTTPVQLSAVGASSSAQAQGIASAPYYCGTTATFCYANIYDAQGHLASTSLATPSSQPIAALIARQKHDGLTGWHVPTRGDWTALTTGATGGLSKWGPEHQLDLFTPETLTSHYGGKDSSLTVIPPVLADIGTATTPVYSVLTAADPSANTLTEEKPPPGDQNALAGRLFLVQDFSSATVTESASPPPSPGATVGGVSSGNAGTTPTALPAPSTRFTTPVACSTASTYVVPAGVTGVEIVATGGAGAAGTQGNAPTAPGGAGGTVTSTVAVTPGSTLYVQVGGTGAAGDSHAGGIGGGGTGGVSKSPDKASGDYSGGGGGASGVSTVPDCSQWLVVAGGGGGGGAGVTYVRGESTNKNGGRGGDGCQTTVPTCAQAADGQLQDSGQKASGGHAGRSVPDNRGGDTGRNGNGNPYGIAGQDGATLRGGNGGTDNAAFYGGGGGGGGGGYYGGGGGGGSGWIAGGGGGAGGASFAILGTSVPPSYGVSTPGAGGSVTITPTGGS